jgi:uncharacterized protein (DUF1800 family)/serine/threonine protein kinase
MRMSMKTQLGHYTVLAELGRGGMGVVYKGYERSLDRYVAIKVLADSLTHDQAVKERFLREARSMAALNNPHIIQIFFIGDEDGLPFFVMEFVEGESLASLLKRQSRLKPAHAAKLIYETALGLAAAQDAGVVHRDVKPGNVMISTRGAVKIADFGIALTSRDFSEKLTSTGEFVGTPGYLSPEVCLGRPVDSRSDIFSLGIVFFECMVGRIPFTDDSPLGRMLEVVNAVIPDVRSLNADVDADLSRILATMIAQHPADRYQTFHELAADLVSHPLVGTGGPLTLQVAISAAAATVTDRQTSVPRKIALAQTVSGGRSGISLNSVRSEPVTRARGSSSLLPDHLHESSPADATKRTGLGWLLAALLLFGGGAAFWVLRSPPASTHSIVGGSTVATPVKPAPIGKIPGAKLPVNAKLTTPAAPINTSADKPRPEALVAGQEKSAQPQNPSTHEPSALRPADIAWLRHSSFDLTSADVERYRALGRSRFLDVQLGDHDDHLPPAIDAIVHSFDVERAPASQLLAVARDEQQRIEKMGSGEPQIAARKIQQEHANALLQEAQQSVLLHAVYGENQLKERMVWFWLNHFSVFAPKGPGRFLAADYADNTIRPHAMGKFKDLVMATLQSPAMLAYLDNAQNARGKVNENYARELMELHTLGVGSGYTQHDVQQLALVLTGVGFALVHSQPRNPKMAALYLHQGLFEFNPARHDFSTKQLLGHTLNGKGFDEVSQAIEVITRQPACAQFISKRLAEYFVADEPSPELIARMSKTFVSSDGDIAKVLRTLFESQVAEQDEPKKYKDPVRFVVSSMRLAYDGKPIVNAKPLVNWLNDLGEPVFGRVTPDGWPLQSSAWTSSGQLAKRFEIARVIGTGKNQLFPSEGNTSASGRFPLLTTRLYYDAIDPYLASATRAALSKATSQQEWNTYLLSSPDFNYR